MPEDAGSQERIFRSSSAEHAVFRNLWLVLVLCAVGAFLIDIAVRKIRLSRSVLDRMTFGIGRLRRIVGAGEDDRDVSYEELGTMIRDGYSQEERRKRGFVYLTDSEPEDTDQRLYIAKLRKDRRIEG